MATIKKYALTVILVLMVFLATNSLHAQETWNTFHTLITDQSYAGLNFRYSAYIRTEKEDPDAFAALWLEVDRNGERGFFHPIKEVPITSTEWKEFSIEGTFDKDYSHIAFGLLTVYNGKFYLDDVNIEVQDHENGWKSIYTADFENGMDDWKKGFGKGNLGINKLYKSEISSINPKSGNQCFLVSATEVPNYGTNSKVGKYADVNGIKLYYEVYGEGHPLVVLHGNGGSSKNAAPHYPELIKRYQVVAVDHRGQGKSNDTDAPLTYETMASDISALLDELNIDSAYVWGQSDGAILGLVLAMDHPQKVKKVLAFGANVQPDSIALFPYFIEYNKKQIREGTDAKKIKLGQLMSDHPNIPLTDLSKINIPVMVMAGDRDVIRPEHTLKLFQHIPNSQLCILPGTTHGASWDKKELFLSLLYDFFDQPFTMPTTEDWYK